MARAGGAAVRRREQPPVHGDVSQERHERAGNFLVDWCAAFGFLVLLLTVVCSPKASEERGAAPGRKSGRHGEHRRHAEEGVLLGVYTGGIPLSSVTVLAIILASFTPITLPSSLLLLAFTALPCVPHSNINTESMFRSHSITLCPLKALKRQYKCIDGTQTYNTK